MDKLTAYMLLLFLGFAHSCESEEYEIKGECCPKCAPGSRVHKHCTESSGTSCVMCAPQSYIDVYSGLTRCFPCIVCDSAIGLKTIKECTITSNRVCGPLDHHYCTQTDHNGCTLALEHSICSPGHFITHNGTTLTDTECEYCPDKTFSTKSLSAYCKPHTDCQSLGLQEITAGTNTSDSQCEPRRRHHAFLSLIGAPVLLLTVAVIILKRKETGCAKMDRAVIEMRSSRPVTG